MSRTLSTATPLFNRAETQGNYQDVRFREKNPPSNAVFVANIPYHAEEWEIREKFEPFGPIQAIRIGYRPDGSSRGFAHVEYVNKEDAINAVESVNEEPIYLLDRSLRLDFSPHQSRPSELVHEPHHKLFFYDFPGDEAVLRNLSKDFESSIISVYFIRDRQTGENIGRGFLDFASVERATEALNHLNGIETGLGSTLKLSYARPPKARSSGGGQRGRRQSYGGDWGGGRRSSEFSQGRAEDGPPEGRQGEREYGRRGGR